jgi:hypothetical protein
MTLIRSIVSVFSGLEDGARAFYQHIDDDPGEKFYWFIRNGDERLDTLDGTGEPEIIYCDVELYTSTLDQLQDMINGLRDLQDWRGTFGTGTIEDIDITDQQDGYEPQAAGDTLPPFSAAFRVKFTLYEE